MTLTEQQITKLNEAVAKDQGWRWVLKNPDSGYGQYPQWLPPKDYIYLDNEVPHPPIYTSSHDVINPVIDKIPEEKFYEFYGILMDMNIKSIGTTEHRFHPSLSTPLQKSLAYAKWKGLEI